MFSHGPVEKDRDLELLSSINNVRESHGTITNYTSRRRFESRYKIQEGIQEIR
ncbi:hypothetical protein HanHA300_Chr04g0122851 [Helianthus annuus]|nr:hypothetical protein HanHA300_Chr04g0122851 [Helianthus annuus]KAJ0595782.1 hypothetical protein HanHA89_Chr04g0135341 [Helianthus annuus]KAJ0756440.1 hypothetical protein HanLR1_Chr04g0127181 [Helianthus annuus]